MKILVPIKRVIDYKVKIRVKADQSDVELANVKMAMNPFCEIALEEALRLKEKGHASEVTVVSIGEQSCQEQLRAGLALGADSAIHIETALTLEPLNIAKLLHKVFLQEQADLIILGKQAIDNDNNQTGQMLAALADLPQATFASKVEISEDSVIVSREVDNGIETLQLKLPAVITADLRLNEPRYATLPNIMKAKRKPLTVIDAQSLSVALTPHSKQISVSAPNQRKAGVVVDSTQALIDKLRNEVKVIS